MIKKFKRITKYEAVSKVFCDKCNCEMEPTGMIYTSCPLKYEYKCSMCGNIEKISELLLKSDVVYTEKEIKE